MFKPEDDTKKIILTSEAQEVINNLITKCSDGDIPYNILQLATQQANKAAISHTTSQEGYEPKYYIGLEVALTAYQRMLEVGGTVDDVLIFAAEECKEDVETILGAKHRKFYYSSEVVGEADEHPTQKAMVKARNIDRKALKQANTISKQLRQLGVFRDIHFRLVALESEVSDLNARVVTTEATNTIQNKRLNELDKAVGTGYSDKHSVRDLNALGYSQKQIASIVNKNVSTIRRWLKEMENDKTTEM